MSEQKTIEAEQEEVISESFEVSVFVLASEFHEIWRKSRTKEDGTIEPDIEPTEDTAWIEFHGTDQLDIANTAYGDLPTDWQAENRSAAEVVVRMLSELEGKVDLNDPDTRSRLGAIVHDAWLSRNEWARGTHLDVPFDELTLEEQEKDIAQVEVGLEVLS